MADLSRKTASIYIDSEPAKIALQNLNIQADKLTLSIAKGQAAGKNMVTEIAKLDKVNTQIAGVQKQIDSGLRPSMNQLTTAVAQANAELKKLSQDDPGYAQKVAQVKALKTELGNLSGQLVTVKENSEAFGGSFGKIFERVAEFTSAYAIITGLTNLIKGTVTAAIEAEQATFRFKGTLDNLGRIDAFDRLTQSAEKLHEEFGFFEKPQIIGVFEQLVTFGKLSENQINALTPVIINFAAKSGQSLKEATTTILSAIEGNARGLKQYGINIKDAKTEAERFGVIMDQLAPKVNGAAAAFGETTQGQIEKTQIRFKELQEEIGNKLLPTINSMLSGFNDFVTDLSGPGGVNEVVSRTVDGFKALFGHWNGFDALDKLNAARKAIGTATPEEKKAVINENFGRPDTLPFADYGLGQPNLDTPFDGGKGLDNTIKAKKEKSLKDESALLNEYLKKNQEQKRLALEQDLKLAQDVYKQEYENQDNSEIDRLESLKGYYIASQKLLAVDTKAKLDAQALQESIDLKKASEITNAALKEKTITAIKTEGVTARANIVSKSVTDEQNLDAANVKQRAAIIKEGYTKEEKALADHIAVLKQLQKEKIDAATDKVDISENTKAIELLNDYQILLDKAHGQKRIDLEKQLQEKLTAIDKQAELDKLKIQEDELNYELASATLIEQPTADIEAKITDNKRKQAELRKGITDDEAKHDKEVLDKKLELASAIISAAQDLETVLTDINDASNEKDANQLAQNQTELDANTAKLDRELRQKVLSQKEYDRQIKALADKKQKEDAAIKKKQFERDQEAAVISTLINAAQAVVAALKLPPPADIIKEATIAVVTAAELGVIASKKPPDFGKGGVLDGPLHSQGGMPITNPATGKKVAEVEGGEPFLSRKTYANNRELVDQLLQASMYGNGARIVPYWQQRSPYQPINYSGVTRTIERIKYYERGGVFSPSTGDSSVVNNTNAPYPPELLDTLNAINIKLGLPVKSYVLISEVNAQNDVLDQIKKDTTIKRT